MIQNHFAQHNTSRLTTTGLSIAHHDPQPLAQQCTPWFTPTKQNMVYNHLLSITRYDLQPLAQHNTPWFTTTRISITQDDSQLLTQHNTTWFTTTWLSIKQHDSQPPHNDSHPLSQYSTTWFTTTRLSITHDSQPLGSTYHTMIHNHSGLYSTPWFTNNCSA
jgi:hypothetical protein